MVVCWVWGWVFALVCGCVLVLVGLEVIVTLLMGYLCGILVAFDWWLLFWFVIDVFGFCLLCCFNVWFIIIGLLGVWIGGGFVGV